MAPKKGVKAQDLESLVHQYTNQDVVLGRGNAINYLQGNRNFRTIVDQYRQRYADAPRNEKQTVAELVVRKVQETGGQFLEPHGDNFLVAPKKRALEKACQALREKKGHLRMTTASTGRNTEQRTTTRTILLDNIPSWTEPNHGFNHNTIVTEDDTRTDSTTTSNSYNTSPDHSVDRSNQHPHQHNKTRDFEVAAILTSLCKALS